MFKVDSQGGVSVVREPSPFGLGYDVQLAEYESDPTTLVEVWFLLADTRLKSLAARQILAERGKLPPDAGV